LKSKRGNVGKLVVQGVVEGDDRGDKGGGVEEALAPAAI